MKRFSIAALLCLAVVTSAAAQQKFELKVAEPVGPQHFMTQWLMQWTERLEKASDGRLAFKHFPGSQLGPAATHYDLARNGQADIAWFFHAGTPGRFPLTELLHLPFVVGSAEIGTKVINDPVLRSRHLDPEHKGVRILLLFTHPPGNVLTTKRPIRSLEEFKGLRIRQASPNTRDFILKAGGTPVGVPPTDQLDQLQKGTLDGTFIDYGSGGVAFKLGGAIGYMTEMYAYVSSFGLAMNLETYSKLPLDLQRLLTESVKGVEKEVGEGFDKLDDVGKKLLVAGGGQPIALSASEIARFRKTGDDVIEARLKELEGKGLPARAAFELVRALSEKHSRDSRSFWRQ
jgi:TRAP-type C4-dicarboxylate transport system substrate-binding protein